MHFVVVHCLFRYRLSELQKKVDELGDAAQTIRNLKSEIEKLKNEQSSTDKTNKDLRKLLEVERKTCKDAEEIVMDAAG